MDLINGDPGAGVETRSMLTTRTWLQRLLRQRSCLLIRDGVPDEHTADFTGNVLTYLAPIYQLWGFG